MDMSNATAAGPSFGLLDVIFGTTPEEATDADGKEFSPMMNLIMAMNNKSQEDEAGNRTDKEIAPGKDAADSGLAGMPGMLPFLMMAQPQAAPAEGASPGAMLEQAKPALASLPGGKLLAALEKSSPGAVDPAMVNQLLKDKSLPPLTAEEAKLLQEVNGKIAQQPETPALPDAKAAPKAAGPQEAALSQELAKKGIDAAKVKGAEAPSAGAAPEKFLSTEAYLQMHDRFGKGAAKPEAEGAKRLAGEEAAAASPANAAELPKGAVSSTEQKGRELFGRPERELPELAKAPKEGGKLSDGAFGAALLQAPKGGLDTRDVVLTGTQPAEIREALLGEVHQGVGFHAAKGGGEMRLVIHPEALGEVKLKIGSRDGKVEVQVTAQNEEVAKIIRGGSKDLESSLKDQNLALSKFDVTVTADAPVASTDTRNSLSDQFLSQQQNNAQSTFTGSPGNESEHRFGQWQGNQNPRQSSSEVMADNQKQASTARQKQPARDGSRRLDVVA